MNLEQRLTIKGAKAQAEEHRIEALHQLNDLSQCSYDLNRGTWMTNLEKARYEIKQAQEALDVANKIADEEIPK